MSIPPQPLAYTIGPPLPAETPKAPWRPRAAGRIAFFFGPIAGAFVSSISLRRMGYPEKAQKVRLLTLCGSVALLTIFFFIPDAWSRPLGLGTEAAFFAIFPLIQDKEFEAWEAANKDRSPSSGWNAIGYGFLGLLLYFLVGVVLFVLLGMMLPGHL
jgi:hypothetical protein